MTPQPVRVLAACSIAVALSSCGFFSKTRSRIYSLEPLPAPRAASAPGAPLGIDGIELPPGLDRKSIVVRGANHQLEVRETHQWASSLEPMVIHTLAFDLANRLPAGMVILPGQARPAGAMRSLYVTFEDLAMGTDGVFVLDARWTIVEAGRPTVAGHERVTVNGGTDGEGVAAAMSQALGQLADRLVARLGGSGSG